MKMKDLEKRLKEIEQLKNDIALLYGVKPKLTNKRIKSKRNKDTLKKDKELHKYLNKRDGYD